MMIRAVDPSREIPKLAALAEPIWQEYFSSLLSQGQIDYMVEKFQSARAMKEQVEEQGYSYFFLCEGEEPVGYMGIKADGEKLFLSKLYLQKAHRGKGYASKAFAFLETYCRERGFSAIWLTVNRHNESTIRIYEKKGFVTIREQVADIGGGYVMDDYVMEKPLSGEGMR